MNKQYERLLLKRNKWDGPVTTLDSPDELLEAVIRRHLTAGKPTITAALLYKYADIVAVHGIEENVAEPTDVVKPVSTPPTVQVSRWQAIKMWWFKLSPTNRWVFIYAVAFMIYFSLVARYA